MSKHGCGEMKVDPVSGAVLGGKLERGPSTVFGAKTCPSPIIEP